MNYLFNILRVTGFWWSTQQKCDFVLISVMFLTFGSDKEFIRYIGMYVWDKFTISLVHIYSAATWSRKNKNVPLLLFNSILWNISLFDGFLLVCSVHNKAFCVSVCMFRSPWDHLIEGRLNEPVFPQEQGSGDLGRAGDWRLRFPSLFTLRRLDSFLLSAQVKDDGGNRTNGPYYERQILSR